jgi:hypothetical protein
MRERDFTRGHSAAAQVPHHHGRILANGICFVAIQEPLRYRARNSSH